MNAEMLAQLNKSVTILPYAICGKIKNHKGNLSKIFNKAPQETIEPERQPFTLESGRLRTATRLFLGKLHTKKKMTGEDPKLPYRQVTKEIGHSTRTTAKNIKQLTDLDFIESPETSTFHIKKEYEEAPFILIYDWLTTEEILLPNGASIKITDLEAMLLSIIANHTFNAKKQTPFYGSIHNIEVALNIPHSTAQALINRLVDRGLINIYRQYVDKDGKTVVVKNERAKSKNEKTLLSTISTILRPCAVIYKEYQKKQDSKRRAEKRDISRRSDKEKTNTPKSDEELFDDIEAKFIRDDYYLRMTERYKHLRKQAVDVLVKENAEARSDILRAEAKTVFDELCYYLYANGVTRDKIPRSFSKLLYTNF